jgi:hypothetical protein
MGLDMYLYGKKYFSSFNEEKKAQADRIGEILNIPADLEVKEISVEFGYWRKANHIHNWFVNNIQKGTDNCGTYYVSPEQLQELHKACKEVLENKNSAKNILPTASGFFFGNTSYDDCYFGDCEHTIKIIDRCLQHKGDFYFSYHSSW